MDIQIPTSEQVRQALLRRANDYAALTGKGLGAISVGCAGDGKFLLDVQRGNNFTIDRYQRAMDWFDENWPGATTGPDAAAQAAVEGTATEGAA